MEKKDQTQEPVRRPPGRGLYDHVNIPVSRLNVIILVLCVLLVICLFFGISHRGFQVTFDTRGGTVVEAQTRMYGERVETPAEPTREGYVFSGWYQDENESIPWNLEEDTVVNSMTLYAGWTEDKE